MSLRQPSPIRSSRPQPVATPRTRFLPWSLAAIALLATGCQSMKPAKPTPLGQAVDSQSAIEVLSGKDASPSWSSRLLSPFKSLGSSLIVTRPADRPHDQLSLDVKVKPNTELFLGTAEYAMTQGNLDQAEEMFRKAVDTKEGEFPATIGLARIAIRRGQPQEALTLYRSLLPEHDSSPLLHNDLGMLADQMGQLQEAEAAYRKALTLDPTNQRYRNNLAGVLVRLGDTQQAIGVLDSQMDPATTHLTISAMLQQHGQTQAAAHHWRLAQVAAQRLPATHPLHGYFNQPSQQAGQDTQRLATRPQYQPPQTQPIQTR